LEAWFEATAGFGNSGVAFAYAVLVEAYPGDPKLATRG
jgi:hypothetical protein